jgi:hypothetical protein
MLYKSVAAGLVASLGTFLMSGALPDITPLVTDIAAFLLGLSTLITAVATTGYDV